MELRNTVKQTKLLESTAVTKRTRDVEYLMKLTTENLLFAYHAEAGLNGRLNYKPLHTHGGWDSPTSQIRGAFTGHWLSAAARIYDETGDMQLKAKADVIVAEIAKCQQANGGQWAFSIPEKYLFGIKKGQHFWAPQYVCHKTMMGLLDMYEFAGSEQAFEIILKCADWFYEFTNDIPRDTMDMMMDIEETGGIMEFWADLYAITKDPRHLELVRRYERPKLINPLFEGKDVLTNIHANTTIPEIHGCARAYEVTGEERYRKIVENYWDLAVTKRGQFATGGQTCGEIWTPMQKQSARLGELNQEHCAVYNMIRLADYLYRWTGKTQYADYIEQNILNGLFAQGFWQARTQDTVCDNPIPDKGLVAYFLPLAAGSQKKWGDEIEHFWCCHCTLVQANAKHREYIYYQAKDSIMVAQYMPSILTTTVEGKTLQIEQTMNDIGGDCIEIKDISIELEDRPSFVQTKFVVKSEGVTTKLKFRMPWWLKARAVITVDGTETEYIQQDGYAVVEQKWTDNTIILTLPKGISCYALADEPNTVAFLDGAVLLVGLVDEQRSLVGNQMRPETLIKAHDEREWTTWKTTYKTVGQAVNFYLKPISEIGKEKYTVYFPIQQ